MINLACYFYQNEREEGNWLILIIIVNERANNYVESFIYSLIQHSFILLSETEIQRERERETYQPTKP